MRLCTRPAVECSQRRCSDSRAAVPSASAFSSEARITLGDVWLISFAGGTDVLRLLRAPTRPLRRGPAEPPRGSGSPPISRGLARRVGKLMRLTRDAAAPCGGWSPQPWTMLCSVELAIGGVAPVAGSWVAGGDAGGDAAAHWSGPSTWGTAIMPPPSIRDSVGETRTPIDPPVRRAVSSAALPHSGLLGTMAVGSLSCAIQTGKHDQRKGAGIEPSKIS